MTEKKVSMLIDERGVATVILNNPEKHNAFDDTIIAQLTAFFLQIGRDKDVRAMILAATGKNFSAGADLSWMKSMMDYSYEENLNDARALAAMLKILNFLPVPTVARVQGGVFGGAVGLVSCCDMVVAASEAGFSLSEVKIGLLPATISPYVIAAIGQRACRRYFMTAERFSAHTAARLGLVSKVVAEEKLDEEVNAFIDKLLDNSPAAIRGVKQLVFDVAGRIIDDDLIDSTSERIADIRVSAEGQEGLSAFFEKRKPAWRVSKNV